MAPSVGTVFLGFGAWIGGEPEPEPGELEPPPEDPEDPVEPEELVDPDEPVEPVCPVVPDTAAVVPVEVVELPVEVAADDGANGFRAFPCGPSLVGIDVLLTAGSPAVTGPEDGEAIGCGVEPFEELERTTGTAAMATSRTPATGSSLRLFRSSQTERSMFIAVPPRR